jgi:hypothetical protein
MPGELISMGLVMEGDSVLRKSEWFVPRFGPEKFRCFVGLLFLPYTGMVLSFVVIGSMISASVDWGRLMALMVIYFLGLGVGAHTLDALGSKAAKPWGAVFTKWQLLCMAIGSLTIAYAIAIYYMVLYVPWLWLMAVSEGFFVFAYNLEWFQGRFHTDRWFAFSWGFLPVLSGYIMQTNSVSMEVLCLALSMSLFGFIEIKASRPYRELKRRSEGLEDRDKALLARYEAILKSVSLGVISLACALLIWRMVR